jgi:hypothetical protein
LPAVELCIAELRETARIEAIEFLCPETASHGPPSYRVTRPMRR